MACPKCQGGFVYPSLLKLWEGRSQAGEPLVHMHAVYKQSNARAAEPTSGATQALSQPTEEVADCPQAPASEGLPSVCACYRQVARDSLVPLMMHSICLEMCP